MLVSGRVILWLEICNFPQTSFFRWFLATQFSAYIQYIQKRIRNEKTSSVSAKGVTKSERRKYDNSTMRNFPLCPLHQSHRFTILCVGPVSPVFREKCRCFRKCLRAVWDELHAPLTFLFLCFPMRFAFSRIVTVTVEIHSIHSYSSTQNLQNHTSHPTTHPQKRNRSTEKMHWPLSLKLIFQHCLPGTQMTLVLIGKGDLLIPYDKRPSLLPSCHHYLAIATPCSLFCRENQAIF